MQMSNLVAAMALLDYSSCTLNSHLYLSATAFSGISPITRDYVSPEKPWPHLQQLAAATAASGKALLPRLPVYPAYLQQQQLMAPANKLPAAQQPQQQQEQRPQMWLDASVGRASVAAAVLRLADAEGLARGSMWFAGAAEAGSEEPQASPSSSPDSAMHRDQETAEAPAALQQQAQQPQLGLRSSMPAVRRRSPRRSWRVAVAEDGLLKGCPGPQQASLEVQHLLASVLEQQHELSEAEIELLFSGKAQGPRGGGGGSGRGRVWTVLGCQLGSAMLLRGHKLIPACLPACLPVCLPD